MTKSINSVEYTLADLADRVGGQVDGDGTVLIHGLAPITEASPGDISFVANSRYAKHISTTKASALILAPGMASEGLPTIRSDNPYLTFAQLLHFFYPDQRIVPPGVHPTAVVHPDARVAVSAGVGPLCHIDAGATVGENCQLVSSVYVGRNSSLGDDCLLSPHVSIMHECTVGHRAVFHSGVVIGADGFGFAASPQGAVKIKQVGGVEIGDDVELGANTTVDRGAIGPTRVGSRTKMDNGVQIGHNAQIGDDCVIVAHTAIAGSTRLGRGVTLAGQVAIVGHLEVGDGATVGAQSLVVKSVPPGQTLLGTPARDAMESKRQEAALRRLPELLKRVKALEKRLAEGTDS